MISTNHDVVVENQGTIWIFYLTSQTSQDWVEENVSIEPYMRLGCRAFACEHRCGPDLVQGMREASLVVVGRV